MSNPTINQNESSEPNRPQVGYKRPPPSGRFQKGVSGNPNGRRKGSPNYADLLRNAFFQKVQIKIDGQPRVMPTYEAITEVLIRESLKGNKAALFANHQIMEMTGRTKEVSEEERARRTFTLPAPFTRDEYDFLMSKAREKERQYCHVTLADKNTAPPSPHATSDEHLTTLNTRIAIGLEALAAAPQDESAREELVLNVSRIGLLADQLFEKGQFVEALECANAAIAYAPLPIVPLVRGSDPATMMAPIDPDPNLTWIRLIRAHALMFLRPEQARAFYLHLQTSDWGTSWQTVILQEFARLRQRGYASLLMDEIEQEFTGQGWTTDSDSFINRPIAPKAPTSSESTGQNDDVSAAPPRNVTSLLAQPSPLDEADTRLLAASDVESGNQLAAQGRRMEALEVYYRFLEIWKQKFLRNQVNTRLTEDREIAVDMICDIALTFVAEGKFLEAIAAVKHALDAKPNATRPNISLAHARMFLGFDDEARLLYRRCAKERLDAQRVGNRVILEELSTLRRAGLTNPLMSEIESELSMPPMRPVLA